MCKCRVDVSFHDPENEVEEIVFADDQMEVEEGLKQLEKENAVKTKVNTYVRFLVVATAIAVLIHPL